MSGQLQAFCHACDDTFTVPEGAEGDSANLVCVSCGSEFVEVVENTEGSAMNNVPATGTTSRISIVPGGTVAVRFSSFGDSSSGFTGVLGGDYNLTHVWDSLVPRLGELSQGLNIGDFSFETALDRIIDHLADAHQPVQTPADSRVFAALPRSKFSDTKGEASNGKDPSTPEGSAGCGENDSCVVCHDEYKMDDVIVTLPCGHFFHEKCIAPWFQERNTCPVCRLALPLQQEEGEQEGSDDQQNDPMDIDEPDYFHSSLSSQQLSSSGELPTSAADATELPHASSGELIVGGGRLSDGNDNINANGPTDGRDEVEGRGEDLRNRINGAQQELEVLQQRLSEQMSEHQRLRGQISELQTQRSQLHTQYYNQQDSTVRLDALTERTESMLSRLAHRLRNALGRDAGTATTNRQAAAPPSDMLSIPSNANRQGATDPNQD